MHLNNGVDNTHKHNEDGSLISNTPNQKVVQILDSTEEVFQVAVIRNQNKPSPVFFKPEKRIDSPFEDLFISANIGLRNFNTGDFIPANTELSHEPNVYRSRPNNPRLSSIGYLVARII